jgi:hypothetical protein
MFSFGGFRNLFVLVGIAIALLFMYNSINNLKQRNIALKNENDKLIASVGRVLLKNRLSFPELNLPSTYARIEKTMSDGETVASVADQPPPSDGPN